MIGVIADWADLEVVREFFELFKTPWEPCQKDQEYAVLLSAGNGPFYGNAKLVLYYAGRKTHYDDSNQIETGRQRHNTCILSYQGDRIPIYGDTLTFPDGGSSILRDEDSRECVAYVDRSKHRVLVRIGYDLFSEIRTLLAAGQPPVNAKLPALELHIAFLRNLITGCGVPLVEIPPVPAGHRFIVCLTHDIDHPSIRQHQWDHTTLGFVQRAVLGSLRNVLRGRMSARDMLKNWLAVLKLPFVQLGLAKDFWRDFDDRYLALEKGLGLRSTFFVIPFKNRPGRNVRRPSPHYRAARYGAQDIADTMQKLLAAGCEVGLHGIDAWLDVDAARQELAEIRRLTRLSELGVRMHWLCFDQQSPLTLEKAGAAYDSTVGYNETVGYRAGTTQAYKPLAAKRLLELPLHVMDTAMYYAAYLDLSPREGKALLGRMVDNAERLGGCLMINWHDRSLAPERLWDVSYRELLQDLKTRGAWFATAGQAVGWFQKRRSAIYETKAEATQTGCARVPAEYGDDLPGLQLRRHSAQGSEEFGTNGSAGYVDVPFDDSIDTSVPFPTRRQ